MSATLFDSTIVIVRAIPLAMITMRISFCFLYGYGALSSAINLHCNFSSSTPKPSLQHKLYIYYKHYHCGFHYNLYYGKDPPGQHKCSCVTIKPLKCLTVTLLLMIYYYGVNKFGADQKCASPPKCTCIRLFILLFSKCLSILV